MSRLKNDCVCGCVCVCVCVCIPAYVVDQAGLQQQFSSWQQVVTDQVLVGAHRHAVTHAQ